MSMAPKWRTSKVAMDCARNRYDDRVDQADLEVAAPVSDLAGPIDVGLTPPFLE
jgi:hypothetical protein